MMKVQQYLLSRSLNDLEQEHGVKARIAGFKFSLNYDQIEAKDSDPIAQECRGLILSPVFPDFLDKLIDPDKPVGDTSVLARPFDRFFNLGQEPAASVNFNHPHTRFYEKMDGTLCILYFDNLKEEWCVATRSVPDADLPIDGWETYTFRTLFEKAVFETTGLPFDDWVKDCVQRCVTCDETLMFELTTPANRIVVGYDDYRITLLGRRNNLNGYEDDPTRTAKDLGVPHPKMYHFGSTEEMVDFVSSLDPKAHEGVVVCDHKYRRVKVKNPGYIALNKVRDKVMNSPRGLVELILLGKLDDALPLLPEHIVERSVRLQEGFQKLMTSYKATYFSCLSDADCDAPGEEHMSHGHRKAFALAVQSRATGWMAPMMAQYQGSCSGLMDFLQKKKNADGGWPNKVLDAVLRQIKV